MMTNNMDHTMFFKKETEERVSPKEILKTVYQALEEKGYNPENQIVGYLISGDPAYITSYQNARGLIKQLERDEYITEMLRLYLGLEQ